MQPGHDAPSADVPSGMALPAEPLRMSESYPVPMPLVCPNSQEG